MQRVNDWRCPDAGILRSFPFERNHISSEHRNRYTGCRPEAKVVTKKSIEAKATILKHSIDFNGTLSDADVMRLAGIARNTYYKYKRELRTEETEE